MNWSRAASHAEPAKLNIVPGTLLGDRYEILEALGQGGMGAVYKARDIELDRLLAVKVIRPELAGDPKTLKRFKQELILARQITHKNVIRIFDLGTHEGVKFITMEFVEGRDLSALLEERRFSPVEAAQIIRQVCRALEAAHAENVIHRDLKPQNVMIDVAGRVLVMDFGLARSVEMSGLTQTGAVLGTPAYMSPEQAKGAPLDERSDLFSLGIIFYELLTGETPFKADTVWASLLKRTQEPPAPVISIAPEVPQEVSEIVAKCLAIDPEERYQNATELALALDLWLGDTPLSTLVGQQTAGIPQAVSRISQRTSQRISQKVSQAVPQRIPQKVSPAVVPEEVPAPRRRRWKAIAAAAVVLVLGFVLGWLKLQHKSSGTPRIATVVVADFNNHTGDTIFDGTLEPMLRLALEGAGFISAYSRTTLPAKLEAGTTVKLDEAAALKAAVSQGLGVVVSGSLDRQGAGYTLSAKVIQAVTGNILTTVEANAANKDQVLFAVTKMAAAIRKVLGDDTSESAQRFAMETLTATSLEAVREYAAAMEGLSNGKFELARQNFSKAVDLDPNFGLAYAGMAIASKSIGEDQDAEKFIKEAMAHIDRMTERERYRTRGSYYVITGDQQKCVEEYSALIARYSSDVAAHNNLSYCYGVLRNIPKAIEETRLATEILPKKAVYRFNLATYRTFAGDFETAERDVRAAQQLNPSYEKGYLTLAYTQLGQGRLPQAAKIYEELQKVSPAGKSMAIAGLADLAVYEGRFKDAVRILESGAEADVAAKKPDAAADKFAALAFVQILRDQKGLALASIERALANSRAVKIRFLAGRALVEAGEIAKALTLAADLAKELKTEPQAYAKLIEAEAAIKEGDARHAITLATDANRLFDTWIGRFDLGRAYLKAGAFTEADSEFDRCIKRRGETMELFIDDVPTYGYLPPVYYYLGRVREGLKSSGFAESYRTYLNIRGKAGEDPLLAEVRRRAGQ